jgi:two-component system KDP operon response regulator KdpE
VSRALVVDDEPQLLRALRINLAARGYTVDIAADGKSALALAARHRPDVVILDLGLPDLDGTEVIAGLRGWTTVPILVLSGRTDSAEKVDALDAGADDYLTKPFSMDELLARLRAVERRAKPGESLPVVEFGNVRVDLAACQVTRLRSPEIAPAPGQNQTSGPVLTDPDSGELNEAIRLTPTEWALLEILLRNPGKLVSQRQLLAQVWGPNYHEETNYLRIYLGRLRRKLEPNPSRPKHLLTEPGMGYRFQP